MHISRALAILVLVWSLWAFAGMANAQQTPPQQVVESVDIQGNRRLRDEDLL